MTVEEWLGSDNTLGIDIWNGKYRHGDETFNEWLDRVSGGDPEIRMMIINKKFLFGGRILANRGVKDDGTKLTLSNCYVVEPPEDNIESIFDCAKKLARTYSYGGGCGVDISKLAPKGAKVHNAAKSTSGGVSFMDLYSLTTELIGQSGRRGALMISISCDHPDIEEFIDIKTDLNKVTKANISVRLTDEFMQAVKDDTLHTLTFTREETGEVVTKVVKARDVFMKLARNNWNFAEPGALFWSRIENWNLLANTKEFKFAGTNPCVTGDTIIHTTDGEITIKDLVGKTPYVYCIDQNGEIVTKQASKVWKTRKNAKLVEVKTQGGNLKCTPDHRIYTSNRGWVEAQDINREDKIVGLYGDLNVIEVTHLDEKEDVYDMTVPEVHNFIANRMVVHNCAEEPLPAGGSCLLGSMNLAEYVNHPFESTATFDIDRFKHDVKIAVKALNQVLDEGLPMHPLQEQRESVKNWRQIGLGIMGLADMLISLGKRYGSKDSLELCEFIAQRMIDSAIEASADLAKTDDVYPKYIYEDVVSTDFFTLNASPHTRDMVEKYGLRNSQLLTIAPTGTLSTMLGISGGIEPIFANYYTRKTESLHGEDVYYKVYTPIVKAYMAAHVLDDDSKLPDYFVTAQSLPYEERIAMQGVWQSHIDASISSTVNVPNEFTVDQVFDLYIKAWETGLKGITIYRDGCLRGGVLTTKDPVDDDITLGRGYVIPVNNNIVGKKRKLTTGCGSLHCTAFFDPETGDLMETYLSKGSTGGCNNSLIGLSRMISLASRSGVDIHAIVDQLNSTGSCPSYAVRHATKKDTSKGACCPMAVGNAIMDMWQEMQSDLHKDTASNVEPEENATMPKCPECGEPLVFEGGCNICKNCGYSKCL